MRSFANIGGGVITIVVFLPIKTETEARLEIQIDLANQENKLIMQGQAIGGTAYIGPIHTSVHVQFMSSKDFQALTSNDPRVQIMTQHVTEELAAQSGREGGSLAMGGGQMGESGQQNSAGLPQPPGMAAKAQGGANRELTDLLTGKMQGGQQQAQQQPGF